MAKDRFDIKEKDGIGLITILLYAAMLMVGCNKDSVSISIERQLNDYPQSRVQDIYKSFCQDNPHYRIIAREIFEREIRPLLE